MRLRTAGLGLALAISASPLLAQSQPAATLGALRPIEDPNITTVRGQFPDPRLTPAAVPIKPILRTQNPATPIPGAPMPGAGTPMVGQPMPVPNPMVTEYRDQNGNPIPYGTPIPLATTPMNPPALVGNPYGPPVGPIVEGLGLETPTYGPGAGYSHALFPGSGRLRQAIFGAPNESRFTVGAEYLLWFVRAQNAPTLFTTSSPQFNGILGQGDTRPLFGDQTIGNTFQTGARFTAGYWLPGKNWGIDTSMFFLGNNEGSYYFNSGIDSLIARPFTRADTGQQFSQLTAYPGLSTGSARIDYETHVWGGDINLKRTLMCCPNPCSRLEALVGFKYLDVSESLNITETFARTPDSPRSIGVPNALSGTVTDQFRTENHFYGANVGLQGEIQRGRWYLQGKATVAFGRVYQTVIINGGQTIVTDQGVTQAAGGLLALPGANIGSYSQNKFAILPEAGFTLGVNLTPRLRLGVGYNIMYLSSVVRPSHQIDQTLDVARIPNFPLNPQPNVTAIARPTALPLKDSDLFIQGINFQLQWTW